jgi:hypothetical protein
VQLLDASLVLAGGTSSQKKVMSPTKVPLPPLPFFFLKKKREGGDLLLLLPLLLPAAHREIPRLVAGTKILLFRYCSLL